MAPALLCASPPRPGVWPSTQSMGCGKSTPTSTPAESPISRPAPHNGTFLWIHVKTFAVVSPSNVTAFALTSHARATGAPNQRGPEDPPKFSKQPSSKSWISHLIGLRWHGVCTCTLCRARLRLGRSQTRPVRTTLTVFSCEPSAHEAEQIQKPPCRP